MAALNGKQSEFPVRFEAISALGCGGGGEVWEVCDRRNGDRLALKLLGEDAADDERAALVREAVALSALEGLGLPRIRGFGRLPRSGRPYLVRDLVVGVSLAALAESGAGARALVALAQAAEQLTVLHRSELFHGDIKPANILVPAEEAATFVDLGLSARWKDGGVLPEGLTPRFAAPELLSGGTLTVRAEVFSLGATLGHVLSSCKGIGNADGLAAVAGRATAAEPDARYPSADEFAAALRAAAGLPQGDSSVRRALEWPVIGIEALAHNLLARVLALPRGGRLAIVGPEGAGRSLLMRRLSWALGVDGWSALSVDASVATHLGEIDSELQHMAPSELVVLADDFDRLPGAVVEWIATLVARGARMIGVAQAPIEQAALFEVPPLDRAIAAELLKRSLPGISGRALERALEATGGRPGELRRLARRLASESAVSPADVERLLESTPGQHASESGSLLERLNSLLDRGRYRSALELVRENPRIEEGVEHEVALARLELGLSQASRALERLQAVPERALADSTPEARRARAVYLGRALIGVGEYQRAYDTLRSIQGGEGVVGDEVVYLGQSLSYLGRHEEARVTLERGVAAARAVGNRRLEGLCLASFGLALQRMDHLDEARKAYSEAIAAAERADDASTLATAQLNLAVVLRVLGDMAGAGEHFDSAVEMGRRTGREQTVRQAMLNLANLDLHLGRWARAEGNIAALEEQADQLPPMMNAQLLGLRAELLARSGDGVRAAELYEASAQGYAALGRTLDAAEAQLEGVLVALGDPSRAAELRDRIEAVEKQLEATAAHRPLLLLAKARIEQVAGDERAASPLLDEAVEASRDARQREWLWRALAARADFEELGGQPLMARRDREEAAAVLESMASRLPRDLREVFWNDPRRRAIADRARVGSSAAPARFARSEMSDDLTAATSTVLEQRLARILEVNADLVGELDMGRLADKIIEHAVRLARAERGFLLVADDAGELAVHARRLAPGDDGHVEFSRSVAERVIASGEPLVSTSARDDSRMAGYRSVHQLMLQSVACVPIQSPSARAIGALYLETRLMPGAQFERELPMLRAFADQIAIALENHRLIEENRQRADELALANKELAGAQERLERVLGNRTERLRQTQKELRATRDVLYGHFGYRGIVGTSEPMRAVYSLVERVKDTDVPVLITGESGTGKEVVARAIHDASPRRRGKFVAINCGAIPEHLLESELFGSVRGAFTGADRDRKGLFRESAQGTILLDEIGEMPQKMQAGLLRVLQDGKVRPVGGTREESVDLRMIFATNRDLERLVEQDEFREDLYYRIHVVEVRLPPLRERREDIAQLVDHFINRFATRYKRERKAVSREALRALAAYDWPGNVRQLEHVLLNAWILSEEAELGLSDFDLPGARRSGRPSPRPSEPSAADERPGRVGVRETDQAPAAGAQAAAAAARSDLSRHRLDEKDRILAALEECNWNRVRASEKLGIPRRTFYRRLKALKIQ